MKTGEQTLICLMEVLFSSLRAGIEDINLNVEETIGDAFAQRTIYKEMEARGHLLEIVSSKTVVQ